MISWILLREIDLLGSKSASLKGQVIEQAADTQSGHATQKPLISYTQKKKRMQQKNRKVYCLGVPTTLPNSCAWFLYFHGIIQLGNPWNLGYFLIHLSGHEPSKIPAVGTWWLSISSINIKAYRHRPRRSQALTLKNTPVAMREHGYSLLLYTFKENTKAQQRPTEMGLDASQLS